MSSSSLSFPLTVLGAVLLLHAAYSCLHYRNLISEYDWPVDAPAPTLPPTDVWWQVLAAFAILLTGQLLGAGPLRPVTTNTASSQSRQAPAYRTREFDLYTTRMGGFGGDSKVGANPVQRLDISIPENTWTSAEGVRILEGRLGNWRRDREHSMHSSQSSKGL